MKPQTTRVAVSAHRWARRALIVALSALFITLARSASSPVGSQQFLAWMVAESVVLVLLVVTTYREIARSFDVGPRDT